MVMLASVGQRGDAARLQQAGFAAYLTKPIKKSQLYDCLVAVLGVDAETTREAPQPIITRHSLKEKKKHKVCILVAEDNAVNQKVALRILEKLGYRADAVADGREAVEALETIPYDLVLMDVQMPEMNGFEATRLIRDPDSRVLRHDIPIVAMTAHALKGDRERCLEAGMDDYVTKPVTAFALDEVLLKHLGDEGSTSITLPAPKAAREAPVGIKRIREIAAGDPEFERELIDSFLNVNERQLVALESAIREEDSEEVTLRAHMINGSSSNAGAMRMQVLALRIEQNGESGDFREALKTFADLKSEFEEARDYLEGYLNAPESSSSEQTLRIP
jgi:CheY-like chemotaxis protein